MEHAAVLGFVESPCGGAARMAGCQVRSECDAAEADGAAIVQNAIDVNGRIVLVGIGTVLEIGATARLDDGDVAVHDVILCAGELNDRSASRAVVVVRVADEENLDIAKVEAERFDTFANERDRRFEAAVDEDEAAGRGDEIRSEVFAADPVHVAPRTRTCPRGPRRITGDAEGRKWPRPLRILLRGKPGD